MITLQSTLDAWHSRAFEQVLKQELVRLERTALPLQEGLTQGDRVAEVPIKVLILNRSETGECCCVKLSVIYTSVVGGSCCADDPSTLCELPEQCTLMIRIDKSSAEAEVILVNEETGL